MITSTARSFRRRVSRSLLVIVLGAVVVLWTLPEAHSGSPPAKPSLELYGNGLAGNWTKGEKVHPIEILMERGRKKWKKLLEGQSKTLAQAVKAYQNRYHRNPPRGFDVWYKWAKENDVKIIDDYDQVYQDTYLFWGISPQMFREREKMIQKDDASFIIHLGPKMEPWLSGTDPNFRAKDLQKLLWAISPLLPADVSFTVSTHDLGSTMIGDDQRKYLEDKIAKGEVVTDENDLKWYQWMDRYRAMGLPGIASACPVDSPAWLETIQRFEEKGGPDDKPRPIFTPKDLDHPYLIHDQLASNDFCEHPDLMHFHGGLSWDHAKTSTLLPKFHQSINMLSPEILLTPLDNYANASKQGTEDQYLPWEEKTKSKLFWRGTMTGDHYSARRDSNWRNSHRIRLHTLTHEEQGSVGLYVKDRRNNRWEWQSWDKKMINKAYTDVGLTGEAFQCEKKDGTCDLLNKEISFAKRVPPTKAAKYKYIADVDGNGWSSRFHRLLLSGSVVIKSTIYPEWYTDWLIPWYHYVPMQVSYSELYMILAFFIGAPNAPSTGHDHLAQEIAEHGRQFALEYWRWEDMQSYMFRLLLEYIRLGRDDRDSWEYTA